MRQRLVTVMNARSDEVDVFMTLPSREGEQFAAAGWYADLSAMSKNEAATELRSCRPEPGAAEGRDVQRQAASHAGMNIEGPILYYRTESSKNNAGVRSRRPSRMSKPRQKKIKACDSTITPFVRAG